MTTPTPKFCYHGNAEDCCDACDREAIIERLKRELAAAQSELERVRDKCNEHYMALAAAQEALRRATTPVANVTLSGDAQYWQDRAQRAEALAESYRKDAERWKEIKAQFSPIGLNIDGNHAWQWRGSPSRLKGPNMDAAIDAAREGK